MGLGRRSEPERRRDPRVQPVGRVRLHSGEPPRSLEARLVDVGARGLRLASRRPCPAPGSLVRLEILLEDADRAGGSARLVLDGRGRVVWSERLEGEETHAGVAFDAPVDVRRSFPEVRVF